MFAIASFVVLLFRPMSDKEAVKSSSSESGDTPDDREQLDVQTVASQPSDDLASVMEIPASSGQPVRYSDTGWSERSVVCQATDDSDYDDYDDYDYTRCSNWCFGFLLQSSESAFALVISGGDVRSVTFQQTCLRDVHGMIDILAEVASVPLNNISVISPDENTTEQEIENIYSRVTKNRPEKLFIFYSGHNISTGTDKPRLNVSNRQGNALDVSRVKNFIENLLPRCRKVFIMLDCCSAGENLLLPMLPANTMPSRIHIQWSSSKTGGKSYMYEGVNSNSVFTVYVISALRGAHECPNRAENCPLCSRLRRVIYQDGYITSRNMMEYVHDHMRHSSCGFTFRDLPLFMTNPVARE